jgi:hypothetical protein
MVIATIEVVLQRLKHELLVALRKSELKMRMLIDYDFIAPIHSFLCKVVHRG